MSYTEILEPIDMKRKRQFSTVKEMNQDLADLAKQLDNEGITAEQRKGKSIVEVWLMADKADKRTTQCPT